MKKLLILSILLIISSQVMALRCHGALIYSGDTQSLVESTCGEPQDKKTLTVTQPLINESGYTYGSVPYLTEVWTYQASPEDFMYKVYFTDKVVTSISSTVNN